MEACGMLGLDSQNSKWSDVAVRLDMKSDDAFDKQKNRIAKHLGLREDASWGELQVVSGTYGPIGQFMFDTWRNAHDLI